MPHVSLDALVTSLRMIGIAIETGIDPDMGREPAARTLDEASALLLEQDHKLREFRDGLRSRPK